MSSAVELIGEDRPPWFRTSFDGRFSPAMRQLLLDYSHIPLEDIDNHVYTIREKAWQISAYPCIGGFSFLSLTFTTHREYKVVLERLKSPLDDEKLIDLGCCFGQALRKLAFDGVPHERLYGSDVRPGLLELGFELFNDRDKWSPASFFPMDIFHPVVPGNLKFHVVLISMVFHLFSLERQIQAAIEIITRLLVDKPGVMIFGSQGGTINPRSIPSRRNIGRESYLHDVDSFKAMWEEVGQKTGTKWEVYVKLEEICKDGENGNLTEQHRYFKGDDMRWLVFSVKKI